MRRSFRPRIAVTILAAALSLALVGGCNAPIQAPPAAQAANGTKVLADMTLVGLDGKPVHFKDLVGDKVALVDVWATWCAPCLAAMPHLQELHEQFKDKGFTVVGIMIDDHATTIGPGFMKTRGITYPVVMDDGATNVEKQIGSVQGIPLMLLIDKSGHVVNQFQGFGDPTVLREAVQSALKS